MDQNVSERSKYLRAIQNAERLHGSALLRVPQMNSLCLECRDPVHTPRDIFYYFHPGNQVIWEGDGS